MISERAQHALTLMVVRAVKNSPLVIQGGPIEVHSVDKISHVPASRVVALTVATYAFRLTFLIHFSSDAATRTHFAAVNRMNAADMDESMFLDAIRECGNICCGSLNRDLVRLFPHIGMSTPNLLDRQCLAYLERLGRGVVQHFEPVSSSSAKFCITVCINDFDDLDFDGDFACAEDTGELEMF
jgi:CheY-specific phosphatase CheX